MQNKEILDLLDDIAAIDRRRAQLTDLTGTIHLLCDHVKALAATLLNERIRGICLSKERLAHLVNCEARLFRVDSPGRAIHESRRPWR
jgi:hypothetical protein